uniref:Uncharacterized protein n=1 Tax=Arundo donax TaxID=35708 RepID=A0A0A9FT14_ARUDO
MSSFWLAPSREWKLLWLMLGFGRLLERHKQKWATLVLQLTSTMIMSILAQDHRPLLRLQRVDILSVRYCNLQRTLSSLLELVYLNGRTKMPYSQRLRL